MHDSELGKRMRIIDHNQTTKPIINDGNIRKDIGMSLRRDGDMLESFSGRPSHLPAPQVQNRRRVSSPTTSAIHLQYPLSIESPNSTNPCVQNCGACL
ncbi:hypothetical protein L484_001133 [Morus notabilis]|uniref:Uncharacterized protein n=1 Tax=Morus notabilis TaxID=981085 RepID=W9RYL5_9ROSA|nr:hypothetical protein L484_001133 [Morus notabilis]